MKNSFSLYFLLLSLMLLTAGCSMDFDYIGQSFAPRPSGAPVIFFNGSNEIPADGYRIIGRGILTVPPKTGGHDTHGELREQARKHGADAVCIVDTNLRNTGIFPAGRYEFSPPHAPRAEEIKLSTKGTPWEGENFRKSSAVSKTQKRVQFQIRFLFLKKSAELEKEQRQKNPLL